MANLWRRRFFSAGGADFSDAVSVLIFDSTCTFCDKSETGNIFFLNRTLAKNKRQWEPWNQQTCFSRHREAL